MKQFFTLFAAGCLGGLITFGAIQWTSPSPTSTVGSGPAGQFVKQQVNISPKALPPLASIDFREAARKAAPAVVHISAISGQATVGGQNELFRYFFGEEGGQGMPQAGSGSGVIYTQDGYIVTNNHVVEGANKLEVTLTDNRKYEATVVGTDPKTDLAVIRINASRLPTLDLADSDRAEIGEWVLAIGNPLELTSTVTAGIISAKGRSIDLLGRGSAIESFIQTDAAVNPGNSGGALVDAGGRLLGINTAIASRTGLYQGYSFAIPVNLVKRIAEDIIQYGTFQRAYLGVEISELDADYAYELGLQITQGVVVEKVLDGGSASYSGLQSKDVIVELNGKPIKSVPNLQEIIGRARPGEVIVLKVNRGGAAKEFSVKLKAG